MFQAFQSFLDGPVDLDIFYGPEANLQRRVSNPKTRQENKLLVDRLVSRNDITPQTRTTEIKLGTRMTKTPEATEIQK